MKKSRFTEEQVTYCLRLAESGTPVADVCRQMGISEATFYAGTASYFLRSDINDLCAIFGVHHESYVRRYVKDF
ncbi:hypothetical protein ABIC75_004601 [Dyella japonica]|uniref:Transposase n=1 Tax=Dyella japonica TaxID=231455 RepID=A0ABV2K1A4_9GAMM